MEHTTLLREAIARWEKVRLTYNLILFVLGVTMSYNLVEYMGGFGGWAFGAFSFGLTMNAFYWFGSLLEVYAITYQEFTLGKLRYVFFILILLVGLAGLVVIAVAMQYEAQSAEERISAFPRDTEPWPRHDGGDEF